MSDRAIIDHVHAAMTNWNGWAVTRWLLNSHGSRVWWYVSTSVIDETAVGEMRCHHQSASGVRNEFEIGGGPHESDALIVGNVGSNVDSLPFSCTDTVQFLPELPSGWPLHFPVRVGSVGVIVERNVVDQHELPRARRAAGCGNNLLDTDVSVLGVHVRVRVFSSGFSVVQENAGIRVQEEMAGVSGGCIDELGPLPNVTSHEVGAQRVGDLAGNAPLRASPRRGKYMGCMSQMASGSSQFIMLSFAMSWGSPANLGCIPLFSRQCWESDAACPFWSHRLS